MTDSHPQPDDIAKRLGTNERYEDIRPLGAGGMGSVFVAMDKTLQKHVAIKLLHSNVNSNAIIRFQQEAKTLSKLSHPNIVRAMDFHYTKDGDLFMIMEHVDGITVQDALETNGRYPVQEALRLSILCADAMQHSHSKGVVHRDLKPSNVMIDSSGRAKILDFGVAKLIETSELFGTLTLPGSAIGSPFYMSPEQLRGETVSEQTDVYALGLMLYIMIAGESPFRAESIIDGLNERLTGQPPSLRAYIENENHAESIDKIIQTALEPIASNRFASMADLRAALEAAYSAVTADPLVTGKHDLNQLAALRPTLPVVLFGGAGILALVGIALFLIPYIPAQEVKEYKTGESIGDDNYLKGFGEVAPASRLERRPLPPEGFSMTYEEQGTAHFWHAQEPITEEKLSILRSRNRPFDLSFIDSTTLTKEHLRYLTGTPIKALDLSRSPNARDVLDEVQNFPNLHWLRLNATAITDEDIKRLGSLPNLIKLELHGCEKFSDAGLETVSERYPNLQLLDIGKTAVTKDGIKYLSPFKHLKRLRLGLIPITDNETPLLLKNTRLMYLLMVNSPNITDKSLMLATRLKHLRLLDVSASPHITEEGVEAIRKETKCRVHFNHPDSPTNSDAPTDSPSDAPTDSPSDAPTDSPSQP